MFLSLQSFDPAALLAQVQPLPGGAAGVARTVGHMRRLVREGRKHPAIRAAALSIIGALAPRDTEGEARALFEFVRDQIRYVRDVHATETLAQAPITLAMHAGDCDDQVILLAALCESVGLPTRFVLSAHVTPGELDHVCLEVLAGDEWRGCDPTEAVPFGWLPPALTQAREILTE